MAIARLRHMSPAPRLVIRGSTHPNVERRHGEAYRAELIALVAELGLKDMVEMEEGYLPQEQLDLLKAEASLVLLPYDSTDQVTSGVLVEAMGAGLPVVATRFPHAVELLSGGAGLIVPHRDPAALALALESMLSRPARRAAAAGQARLLAQGLAWSRIATQYQRLAGSVVRREGRPIMESTESDLQRASMC